jgi:hypothetical protein
MKKKKGIVEIDSCPQCGSPIVFLNDDEYEICPVCLIVVYNKKINTST